MNVGSVCHLWTLQYLFIKQIYVSAKKMNYIFTFAPDGDGSFPSLCTLALPYSEEREVVAPFFSATRPEDPPTLSKHS